MFKQLFLAATLSTIFPNIGNAEVLEDFESYEIGTSITLFNCWGNAPAGTAEVVADPSNAKNKVLHVTISSWGTFVPVTLPEELLGKKLIESKDYVTFRIRRAANDANDYKKIQIYQDKALVYEDESYPHQGDKNAWQQRSYTLPSSAEALDYGADGGKILALGFNSDASEYYIDDITVKGKYDDYVTIDGTVTKDISKQNTSSSYETFSTPLRMLEGSNLILKTARYTYITSPIIGKGRIDIYGGGERTYLGGSDKKSPDWTEFKGDVHVWPYQNLSTSNGFYGLMWMHNGKTFNPDAAFNDMAEGKANYTLQHSRLTLHKGATLGAESGNRGIRIGHLETEEGSQIYGYVKANANNSSYYVVGYSNDDATLAGRISPVNDKLATLVGIVKEGLGTYRITGNTNVINGAVRVLEGRVLINNNAVEAKAQKLSGGIGTPESAETTGLYIMKNGIAGGTGNIAATTNVYGILQPGDDGISTLAIADYANNKDISLILRPTARIDCEIANAQSYDKVEVEGAVTYYNIDQEFAVSEQMPRLRIQLTKDADLHEGDEFTLFTSKSKTAYQNVEWDFDIIYPKAYTWKVEQKLTDDGFKVIARVTSLTYSGQGDVEDNDDKKEQEDDNGNLDIATEKQYNTPLRNYTDKQGTFVGTCVPVWSINVDDDNESRSALIAKEYNMVVCENEMKFDATEPNKGSFDYSNGDRLVNFANRHNMRVRGHALAWHSQVPAWLTSDGKKNSNNLSRQQLLDILHNHIKNVVTHWKGKVKEWDVANEVLDDNQQTIYSDPKGYDLRPSVWATGIGEDFLDSAFVWAHKYDPDAVLILNDYDVEAKGAGKSEALYNLAMRLRNDNIPIHGVGLQCHLDAGAKNIAEIDANIARFKEAGFECHITELDLGIDDASEENLQKQAETYYSLARVAMKHDNCKSLMIWGLSDDLTWRTGRKPLLFDSNLQKKPAYWGVHAALRQAAEAEASGIEEIGDKCWVSGDSGKAIYNLQGQRVSAFKKGKIYITNGKKYMY
ncbi:MAG: endo-1,4-beta-xylanase [Prevotellaceae bacterium]|nr:endo-1,4-beta-xylanase [Prevotellaceae bacterium]